VLKHFHHLDTHWTCANHGVPSDHILRCHLVEESPSILPNSHILHTCQPSYCPLRHLNPCILNDLIMSPPAHFKCNTGTCIQQSHKMVTHLPVAFIEIVSVPFAPTFHIHVNQAIPHEDIRLLDMLLKTK